MKRIILSVAVLLLISMSVIFGGIMYMSRVAKQVLCCSVVLLSWSCFAMEDVLDWDMIQGLKASIEARCADIFIRAMESGTDVPELFNLLKDELYGARRALEGWVNEIDHCMHQARVHANNDRMFRHAASQKLDCGHEYIRRLTIVHDILKDACQAQRVDQQLSGQRVDGARDLCHKTQCSEDVAVSILTRCGVDIRRLPEHSSLALRRGSHIIGFVRSFGGNLVIELKGPSQSSDMECGLATYVNACILRSASSDTDLVEQLYDRSLRDHYAHEFYDAFVQRMAAVYGSADLARLQWETMVNSQGLGIDAVYGMARDAGIFLVADDAQVFRMFPSKDDIRKLFIARKQDWLRYSFYQDLPSVIPDAYVQRVNFPMAGMVLTGHNLERAGHWIAARYTLMPDGHAVALFVDSCGYAREPGRPAEAVDKIEAYKGMFDHVFKSMRPYISSVEVP